MARYTTEQLQAMPDYVIRYLAPMQCMDEVREESVRRYVLQNLRNCDMTTERVTRWLCECGAEIAADCPWKGQPERCKGRPIDTSFNVYWAAWFKNEYDGAPDSNHPMGMGRTEQEAIDDLIEQDEERCFD